MSRLAGVSIALWLSVLPAFAEQAAGPKAFLRQGTQGYYVALVLDPPAAPNTPPDRIVAAVYKGGKLLTRTVGPGDNFGASYTMPLGDVAAFGGDGRGLLVAVSSYPTAAGTGSFAIPVALEVQVSINASNPQCDASALALQVASDVNRDPTPYETARLKAIQDFVRAHPPKAQTELRAAAGVRDQTVDFGGAFELPTLFANCFVLRPGPGVGVYDLKLTFADQPPVELLPALLRTNLSTPGHRPAPFSIDGGAVGKRAIEENLDLGVQLGSSVSKDAAGVSTRTTKAALDLRLAPLLNLMPLPEDGSNSLWFLTPFLLDARVSTGDVTKETLAQNRIVFGTDVELRHYSNPTTYPTYQRWIFSFRNAADRDFNQAEWKGGAELQAFFSAWNHPLAWQEETEASVLDPTREPKRFVPATGVGWQIVPIVGVELGHTWRDDLTVAAIEKTTKVYRAYFGTNVAIDVTRYLTVSVRELVYLRGEVDTDQARNYLLVKAELPLPGFSTNTAQAVFFSYERGGQPPFSTPDVNALKLGYRLLWNGWAQQLR
jgi:hypothetical protein